LSKYGISNAKLTPITPLYNNYIQAEAVAANPDTATTGARRARDEAGEALKKEWRKFLNETVKEYIRQFYGVYKRYAQSATVQRWEMK
jgi:hypothetical protein